MGIMEIPNMEMVVRNCPTCGKSVEILQQINCPRVVNPLVDCYSCRDKFRRSRKGGFADGEIIAQVRDTER